MTTSMLLLLVVFLSSCATDDTTSVRWKQMLEPTNNNTIPGTPGVPEIGPCTLAPEIAAQGHGRLPQNCMQPKRKNHVD